MHPDAVPFSAKDNEMQVSPAVPATKVNWNVDPALWVDEHGDYLFRFALARVRDASVAEDVVQEGLLAALQSMPSYSGKASERTWLTSIVRHKVLDHFRRTSRQVQFTDEDLDIGESEKFFDRPDEWNGHWAVALRPVYPDSSPEDVVERSDFWKVLNGCLGALPERVASVFALREMDGLSTEEVCELLSLSSSNFWVIMHRARMQLRRCVEIKWFKRA
jgi:RNA polymerase sigma-70 factor, ECF subfamily